MPTTGALLAVRELGLSVLVKGPADTLETEILRLHTTELSDPPGHVGRTELVMTNGSWRPNVSDASFVGKCCRAGASGIVFGLLEESPQHSVRFDQRVP